MYLLISAKQENTNRTKVFAKRDPKEIVPSPTICTRSQKEIRTTKRLSLARRANLLTTAVFFLWDGAQVGAISFFVEMGEEL